MSFIFTMRSAQNSSMRRDPPPVTSLQRIEEDSPISHDAPLVPPVPPRNRNRPRKNFPFSSEDNPPPPYNLDAAGVDGPHGEKLADIRRGILNNKQVAKRGGWARLCLIALVAMLVIIGLVVGLVVGLRNHHSPSNHSNSSISGIGGSSNSPVNSTAFPAGSYSFETFLSSVGSNCTSNPATWMCYPYFTYNQSRPQSNATFQWIINPVADTENYTISSSANPFAITFENISLTLERAGQSDEYYYFQTFIDKTTIPKTELGTQNVAATCYFNQTIFRGYLYTKKPKTFPDNSTVDTGVAFGPWPYAVNIEQIAHSGTNIPTCLGPSGQSLGDFSIQEGGDLCDCLYLNTGT